MRYSWYPIFVISVVIALSTLGALMLHRFDQDDPVQVFRTAMMIASGMSLLLIYVTLKHIAEAIERDRDK